MSLHPFARNARPEESGPIKPPESSFRWATVVQASPVRIRLDGDTEMLPVAPDLLIESPQPGERVWCQLYGRRAVVLGRAAAVAGGVPPALGGAVPVGSILPYAGATAPSGWLIADGSAVSRTTYEALFAVCGTTYGVGNGSTTFNLPNMKGQVAAGLDTGQTEFNTRGKTGGAKTHTLTAAQMPSHTHNFLYGGTGYASWPFTNAFNNQGGIRFAVGTYDGGAVSIQSTGGGAAHNNLQPYIVLNHIIRAL